MVWPFNRGKKEPAPTPEASPAHGQTFLEDLPPKFDESAVKPPAEPVKPSISQTVKNISLADFKFTNLIAIPCFREAGISGFTSMATFGVVMFFYHKNINRAVNWAYGGFFIGSIFGWEQCNSVRRHSQMTATLAKRAYEDRQRAKAQEKYKEFLEYKSRKND